jgi:hypothetical protein
MASGLSLPDQWTEQEIRERYNVAEDAPGFGDLSSDAQQGLTEGWDKLEEVALFVLRRLPDADEATQKTLNSIYEAAFHFTAQVVS